MLFRSKDKFDEADLQTLGDAILPADDKSADRDWSRADLNADGFTGGGTKAAFDLDPSGGVRTGPASLTTVTEDVDGVSVEFDEHTQTDKSILCYYAYSRLYSGDPDKRTELLGAKCKRQNGKIAFTSDRDGNGEIYAMNADGSGQINLTNNPATDGAPSWSFDGTKIAFTSFRDGNGEVYVMNADGSGQTRLTNNPASDSGPTWSPDGTQIAFTSLRDAGNSEIDVMKADGSGQTRLTNNPASDSGPAWSPDGTKIAFTSRRDGNAEIYSMNADGSDPTNLTHNAPILVGEPPQPQNDGVDEFPSWSPDGRKIAFMSDHVLDPSAHPEIFVMNADGSGQTDLTNSPESDLTPSWSPDGRKIAFVGSPGGSLEILVMNADGSGQTNVTAAASNESVPNWGSKPPS